MLGNRRKFADGLREELIDRVILPLQLSAASSNELLMPPKGVLLYGPPGCGKTLTAKAVARAAGARFINLQVSTIFDKWYGESQKITAAIFSLARKIQPCIIFIDEIDSLLRTRASNDHESTAMVKAQFMSLWDGFISSHSTRVVIMGATNRPQDVDAAILRRMPARFHVAMPSANQRSSILEVIMAESNVDVPLAEIAGECAGMSGSDLREVCRIASITNAKRNMSMAQLSPINRDDLLSAVQKVTEARVGPSGRAAARHIEEPVD